MVRVNFNWILAGLVLVLGILWMGNLSAKTAMQQAQSRFHETRHQTEKIVQLRREWEGQTQARKRIERLLASKRYRELGKTVKDADGVRADLDDLDATALEDLLNPLLQSPVAIKNLSITRKEESRVSLKLELAP